jgi:malate synthase
MKNSPLGPATICAEAQRGPRDDEILTPQALAFLGDLHQRFEPRRIEILKRREQRQEAFDAGSLPDFLENTADIRESDWKIAPIPKDLQDRRVEITGPVDRKMMINALNSGANAFMADFEDATSPTWRNIIDGQINLKDRWQGALSFTDPGSGKSYALNGAPAVLIVRPRGWHLLERHVLVNGAPMSGALVDFGLYFFHNARAALAQGSGPYFYLPKIEAWQEASLWNDIFVFAQGRFRLPVGAIKATVLIETLPAAFEMEEILYALEEHVVGLNCGRWDYIFSFIKRLGKHPQFLTPDRAGMGMDRAFLRAYSLKLIQTCHKRGAFAMGGMAAQIPVKGDEAANEAAFAKVRADKEREAANGHDGTWVAHPALVPVAKAAFDCLLPQANQLNVLHSGVTITREDMIAVHDGVRTEEGVRGNIRVGVLYMSAWLGGRGAVPLYNLMEDAATAEISRTQLWQWLFHEAALADGRKLGRGLFDRLFDSEAKALRKNAPSPSLEEAIAMFYRTVTVEPLEEFLTLPAYEALVRSKDNPGKS